jgi:hypothetical protein
MNRWVLIVLATCVFGAACDDDNGVGPTNAPMVFSAVLSPANEVPPVSNAESVGRGAMQVTFAGNTASFYIQLTGFPGNTTMVGAHIHPGVAGVNSGVLLGTPVSAAAPVALTGGTLEYSVEVAVTDAVVQQIANNPSAFYFNVHSPANPGGFARGQLQRVQ